MKKLWIIVAMLVLSLSIGVAAMAQGKMGRKGGCASCSQACPTPEQMKKFKSDSIDLRQEMVNKRFELQRENLKDAPDSTKVAAIKADIEAVKAKIIAMKTAAKLPDNACGCLDNCPLMDGNCNNCQAGKKTGKKGRAARQCDKVACCCCNS